MTTVKPISKKRYYTLVTGEIVFLVPIQGKKDEFEGPYAVRLNTILTDDFELITEKLIGQAQQSLQIQFFDGRDPTIQVQDVVILNLSAMGRMSKEEFHKAPAGTERREVTTEVPSRTPAPGEQDLSKPPVAPVPVPADPFND